MKVMHLVLRPRFSGAEILARDLCLAQKRMGHETAFIGILPAEDNFIDQMILMKEAGVTVISEQHEPSKLGRLIAIRRACTEFQPDVIFAHSIIPAAYSRIADLPIRRTVTVLHAASNADYQGKRWIRSERVLRYLSRGVIAVSELGAMDYRAKFKRPAKVILNGLNLEKAKKASKDRRARTQKGSLIIQVGRIIPVKGQHITIEAMREVVKVFPNARLKLAGLVENKEYQAFLKELVTQYKLNNNVDFLGPRSDILELLAAADVFVMPSFAESQGISLLEALAVGVPSVISDIDVFCSFEGHDGVLIFPAGDPSKMSKAIINSLRETSIHIDRDLSKFNIEETAKNYMEAANWQ